MKGRKKKQRMNNDKIYRTFKKQPHYTHTKQNKT